MIAQAPHVGEIYACMNDPLHFISKHIVKFAPGGDEGGILLDFDVKPRTIILSYTDDVEELLAAYTVWYALFRTDQTIAIAAPTNDSAREFMRLIYEMIDKVPDWLKPKILERTQRGCRFDSNTRIFSGITKSDNFRGHSISMLLWLQAGRTKSMDQQDFYNSIVPTLVPRQSKIIIESAAHHNNSSKTFFLRLFDESYFMPGTGFNPIRIGQIP